MDVLPMRISTVDTDVKVHIYWDLKEVVDKSQFKDLNSTLSDPALFRQAICGDLTRKPPNFQTRPTTCWLSPHR